MRGEEPSLDDFPDGNVEIWSWNINGLNARIEKGELNQFINKKEPLVLCMNEIKTDLEKLDKKLIPKIRPGYAQYWNCCKVKKGYAGTGIMTKVRPISV